MLSPTRNQLAGVDDVFNAVLMKGDMLATSCSTAAGCEASCPPAPWWRTSSMHWKEGVKSTTRCSGNLPKPEASWRQEHLPGTSA